MVEQAQLVVEGVLARSLTPEDLSRPVTSVRATELDAIVFAPLRRNVGVVRTTIYDKAGLVLYSSDPGLIGGLVSSSGITRAIRGETSREVSRLDSDETGVDRRKVLEVYVPIRASRSEPASAAFEVYEDYARVSDEVRAITVPIGGMLALVTIGLFVSLLPLLRRTTRIIDQRSTRLMEQAEAMRRHLDENRETAEALAVSEAQLRVILRQLPALVITGDTEHIVTSATGRAAEAPAGRVLVGRPLPETFSLDGASDLLRAHTDALLGQSAECSFAWHGRQFSATVEPVRRDDRITGTLCVAVDITDHTLDPGPDPGR